MTHGGDCNIPIAFLKKRGDKYHQLIPCVHIIVTYTMQLNPSLHEYFTSDKIVLKGVKTHDSRYKKGS